MRIYYTFICCYLVQYIPTVLSNNTDTRRELNGKVSLSPIESNPYVVVIGGVNSRRTGTGVILTYWWVLTVAHLMLDTAGHNTIVETDTSLIIYAGTSDFSQLLIEGMQRCYNQKLKVHADYRRGHDIALVMLERKLLQTKFVERVNFITKFSKATRRDCVGYGFGLINSGEHHESDNALKKLKWVLKRRGICKNSLKKKYGHRISNWLFRWPEYGVGSCHGDSGGPVLCDDRLTGLIIGQVPFEDVGKCIIKAADPEGECGTSKTMGIVLEVCEYMEWIHQVINREEDKFQLWQRRSNCAFPPSSVNKPTVCMVLVVIIVIRLVLIVN